MNVSGFDWDAGNREKCQKHGLSIADIEAIFAAPLMILPDHAHSETEERLRAIGMTKADRHVFLVFTIRERTGKRFIRPISARYMHRKEIEAYEKANSDL
jgi:hypothetical protein